MEMTGHLHMIGPAELVSDDEALMPSKVIGVIVTCPCHETNLAAKPLRSTLFSLLPSQLAAHIDLNDELRRTGEYSLPGMVLRAQE
jgi:hypothetical protein